MSAGTRKAAQAALAAEHAAVYGYGVVGGRVAEGRRAEAVAAYHAHRARRDALTRTVRGLGGEPVAAQAAYALPFAVPDPAAAVRLAAVLEDRVAGVYSDLVRAAEGPLRREAADALREAAVRAVRWRGSGVAFPGLVERSADGTGAKAGTATNAGSGAKNGADVTNGSGAAH
ncbi:ferritin-like domain-containing protein [Streptomyces sp. NPDC058240]|uniref:ferritin-like domain-containing protein n=1 Tax=Streptomyces sp. NPDC058240 TaxID=3346396 RepID=UPI0036ECC6E5